MCEFNELLSDCCDMVCKFGVGFVLSGYVIICVFECFVLGVMIWVGLLVVFGSVVVIIVLWFVSGFVFYYFDVWQLVINIGIMIIMFLMVFLLQCNQNCDSVVLYLKFDELFVVMCVVSDWLIGIEDVLEEELCVLVQIYVEMVQCVVECGEDELGGICVEMVDMLFEF